MISLILETARKSEKQVYCCSVSPNGFIAAGCSDGSIILVKPDVEKKLNHHKYPVTAVRFTDKLLVSACADHNIVLYDLNSDEIVERLAIHKGPVRCLTVSQDKTLLLSGSSDQSIAICSLLEDPPSVLRFLKITESDSGMLSGLCMSEDNSLICAVATSGTVFLYDSTTPKPVQCYYDVHEMGVNGCDITVWREENLLCTVGADYLVKLWYIKDYVMTSHRVLSGHTGQVLCTKFGLLPDGELTVFTGSIDKSVTIWSVEKGEKEHQSICHSSFIYDISTQGDTLVTCSSDKSFKKWRVCSGKVKTINVIPIAHQDKLSEWSTKQVQAWLSHLMPDIRTNLSGLDLVEKDLEELSIAVGCEDEDKLKFFKSVSLLRAFDGVPAEFLCPISMEIMKDPVVATDGHSYERSNITEWLSSGHCSSPYTNTTLSTRSLVSNHNLRKVIQTVFFKL